MRVVWRPDEASGAGPEVGDGVSTLTSSVPGHKAGQVEVRVRPEEYLERGGWMSREQTQHSLTHPGVVDRHQRQGAHCGPGHR